MDMCFDPVAAKILHVIVNTAAVRDHVGDIKIGIRVLKKCKKSTLKMLSFREIPKLFIVELVYFNSLWLNFIPEETGISKVY